MMGRTGASGRDLEVVKAEALNGILAFIFDLNWWQTFRFGLLVELGALLLEVAKLSLHLVAALHFVHEISLEGVDMRVELNCKT